MMQFEFQTIDGHDIRIARVQRGGRQTMVMTNAFPQSIRCWESVWDRLAEHVDLLAVDLAGFGKSTGTIEMMRPSAQAKLLAEVMDAVGVDRAFIVGPDVGVPVALWLAQTAPERVSGVNIFDGPGIWPTDFDAALRAATRSRLVRWLGTRAPLRERLMRQNFDVATNVGYHHYVPSPAAIDEYRTICFDRDRHDTAFAFLGSYADELPIIERQLPSMAVPVLITWGAHDQFVRPSNAHRLHELLPDSELTIFDDAGHFSHEDADEEWLVRMLSFVARHSPATPERSATGEGSSR
ncbi:MAG: alpha/beta hydrolase [Actinomycetota bacterium]